MTEQLTFHLPTVPVLLPDKPPPAKKPFPRRPKECGDCGSPLKGSGLQPGDLCSACRVVRPLDDSMRSRICCQQLPRRECPAPCARGECYAIPY